MRKIIGTSLLIATLGLPVAFVHGARAADVQVEKKTTTTTENGTVVIENENSRTFKLQGHTETYVAPPSFNLGEVSGKEVTVSVGPDGKVTKIEKKTTTNY